MATKIITSGYNGYGRNCDQPASGFVVQGNDDNVSITGVTPAGGLSKVGIAVSYRLLPDVIANLQAAYADKFVTTDFGELSSMAPRTRARRRPAAEKAARAIDPSHRRNGKG